MSAGPPPPPLLSRSGRVAVARSGRSSAGSIPARGRQGSHRDGSSQRLTAAPGNLAADGETRLLTAPPCVQGPTGQKPGRQGGGGAGVEVARRGSGVPEAVTPAHPEVPTARPFPAPAQGFTARNSPPPGGWGGADVVLQTPFDKGSFGNDLLPAARPRPAGGSYYRKPLGIAGRAPLFWALRFRQIPWRAEGATPPNLVANPLTWLVLA